MNKKIILIFLSLLFVFLSFTPSLYEIYHAKDLPKDRIFVLEHNYMFDYNFYISRIREGQEDKWLITEKYYNKSHLSSLFQIIYLYLGKAGKVFSMDPQASYHASRIIFGFILLYLIGLFVLEHFDNLWAFVAYLLIVTSGSYPILIKLETGGYRFGTYMGWWSAMDSLQRITFIPHVLIGQIFILIFIWKLATKSIYHLPPIKLIIWGLTGFVIGIIFPPTLIVVYAVFGVISFLELFFIKSGKSLKVWINTKILPKFIFFILSFPSFIYLQYMFRIDPWKALALFDIQHRINLPYNEYMLALGPVLPLGVAGMITALIRREKKFVLSAVWILAIWLLFLVFEKVPQQSPSRFTEALIHIPLGMLTAYFFYTLWNLRTRLNKPLIKYYKVILGFIVTSEIVMGILVMLSMVMWLTDQAYGKRVGGWQVPIGAQVAYPLKGFMDGIYFIRDNTPKNSVIMTYITAGNFIPAYAGQYVYIGHANTPDEDGKEKIAASFYRGQMSMEEARDFLVRENASFVYFGPQEKELGKIEDLKTVYPFLSEVYRNQKVLIYKVI